jgi:hypothetical protein
MCYGFEIGSHLAFSLLRYGSADQIVQRNEPSRPGEPLLLERFPRSDRPLHATIYTDGSSYRRRTDREGWFVVDACGATAASWRDRRCGREGPAAGGPRHFGKTTLATAFMMEGGSALSEDVACCRLATEPSLLPVPALLRIRSAGGRADRPAHTRRIAGEPGRGHVRTSSMRDMIVHPSLARTLSLALRVPVWALVARSSPRRLPVAEVIERFGADGISIRPRPLMDRLGTPQPPPGDAFRLRRLLPPALGSRHQIAQVFRLPAPNAMAFLAGYVVPSREFLREARDIQVEGSRG